MTSRALAAELICDEAAWQALAPHWEGLLRATPDATPWQSLHWLEPWWRHLGRPRRLMIVAVRRAGVPCLVLPLQLRTAGMLRVVEPIGMPEDINRPALALGPPDDAARQCALEALWARREAWDALQLDEQRAADPEVAALMRFAADRALALRRVPLHPCPRLDLRQAWPDYLASRGRRLRKNLAAARRRLAPHGEPTLEQAASPAEIARAFEIFLEVFERSWKQAAGLAFARSAAYRECYRAFLMRMAERGAARILILRCGPRAAAAAISIIEDGVCYGAQIAHDAELDRASPGTLLEAMELEALMREGRCREYDFFGAALANKRRWTEDLRPTERVLLLRRTARAAAFSAWYFRGRPLLRALVSQARRISGSRPASA